MKSMKTREKCTKLQYFRAQGDIFRWLVLYDQHSKTQVNQFTIKYNKEKIQILSFEKPEPENVFAFLLNKSLKLLINSQNSVQLMFC